VVADRPTLASASLFKPLTPAKARVAECVADGLTYPEIALRLGLSRNTVQHYVHSIAQLIEIRDITHMTPYRRVQVWMIRVRAGIDIT
jgi:DNA-binding NarL/FixJ family response regulator